MNWRRGISLAAIHLVIAGALMSWEEFRFYRQERGVPNGISASLRTVAWQEGPEMPIFDPCKDGVVDYFTTPAEIIVQQANLPAMFFVGWRVPLSSPLDTRGGVARGIAFEASSRGRCFGRVPQRTRRDSVVPHWRHSACPTALVVGRAGSDHHNLYGDGGDRGTGNCS